MRKARLTIVCIAVFSVMFNVPHGYFTLQVGNVCIPFGNSDRYQLGEVYYWLYSVVNFLFPFVSILIMNIVIIYTLRKRSTSDIARSGAQGQGQDQTKLDEKYTRMKNVEKQIFKTLLLLTFSFLILNAPGYAFIFYAMFFDYTASPGAYAEYYLMINIARHANFTNYGINFFLYVISGNKFRSDLVKLFKCTRRKRPTICRVPCLPETVTITSGVIDYDNDAGKGELPD